ncbi:MAG: 8-oxo-dGTP pyrophosphatase MutT (NUDIX family) [Granulosicoccus sp.]
MYYRREFLSNDVENHLRTVLISISEVTDADNRHVNSLASSKLAKGSAGALSVGGGADAQKTHHLHGRASVLVPLVKKQDGWHIILTLRAKNMRHHGGEVAFPGGMWEEGDLTLVDTALRECEEEIAIPASNVSILGGLNSAPTRRSTLVRPVVGVVKSMTGLMANPREIADIFTVPVDFFNRDQRIRTDIFSRRAERDKADSFWVPAYQYQQYEIWGFTAAVIVELVNRGFGAGLTRENSAPEKKW